jgi:hypothetical protein
MPIGSRRATGAALAAAAWALGIVLARGQAPSTQKPLMAEDVFKNVRVLRGISVGEFMGTMGVFSAALGMSCEDCHQADDSRWENYAIESPRKQMARAMVTMMATINKTHFGGRQVVTCFTCHRGNDRPRVTPGLDAIYSPPPPEEPDDVIQQASFSPPPDEVLDKYLRAVGGADRLSTITSIVATGTSVGYGPESEPRPVEIYARPNRRTVIIHTSSGDSTTAYNGREAWVSAPHRPVAVLQLHGHELEGVRLDADLAFPAGLKQALTKWRVGLPTAIGDRDVQVVQGTSAGGADATLFFDDQTGLLVRQVRYAESPVGRIPTQIDYDDYREVAGVRMPFRWTVTWLDGRDTFEIKEVRTNVGIDEARFARPAPPVAPAPRAPR